MSADAATIDTRGLPDVSDSGPPVTPQTIVNHARVARTSVTRSVARGDVRQVWT